MRLTTADASFLYTESVSGPMHISSVYILEGELSHERVVEHFASRLHLVPSYRRKLAHVPMNIAHPEWVDDPDFELANHVLEHRVPEGSTLEQGMDAAIELNETMLDRSRPLWLVYVIRGVANHTLLLQMTHHAMIDGASGIELTTVLYDFDPKGRQRRTADRTLDAAARANPNGTVQPRVARKCRAPRDQRSGGDVQGHCGKCTAAAARGGRVVEVRRAAGGYSAVQRRMPSVRSDACCG